MNHKHSMGFTLIEMAVVLLIMGLLLGGGLTVLTTQMDQQRVRDTRRALDEINQTLVGFAVANRFLPCPADPALATATAGAGVARAFASGACTGGNSGVLPWSTLGVSETDAWGNRYTYRVTPGFADNTTVFTLGSVGNINVRVTSGGAILATALPAVIVSHGKNGFGAYNSAGTQVPVSANADEIENSSVEAAAGEFVNRDHVGTYDDIVGWVSPNILFNRMVQAGRLPL